LIFRTWQGDWIVETAALTLIRHTLQPIANSGGGDRWTDGGFGAAIYPPGLHQVSGGFGAF
jgi:hypothetical protein